MPHPIIEHAENVQASHRGLRRKTYQDRGRTIGAIGGAAAGAAFLGGAHASRVARKLPPMKAGRVLKGYGLAAGLGALGGAAVGETAGTFVRRDKPLKKEKLFQTMNPTTKARLVQLNAKVAATVTEFRSQDEESHALRNTAIGVGALGAGYVGASALRGARRMKAEYGSGPSTVGQLLTATRMGHAANMGDLARGANAVSGKVTQAARNSKAAALIAKRRAGQFINGLRKP